MITCFSIASIVTTILILIMFKIRNHHYELYINSKIQWDHTDRVEQLNKENERYKVLITRHEFEGDYHVAESYKSLIEMNESIINNLKKIQGEQ